MTRTALFIIPALAVALVAGSVSAATAPSSAKPAATTTAKAKPAHKHHVKKADKPAAKPAA